MFSKGFFLSVAKTQHYVVNVEQVVGLHNNLSKPIAVLTHSNCRITFRNEKGMNHGANNCDQSSERAWQTLGSNQ